MIIYESEHTGGSLDIETKAYYDTKTPMLTLVQVLHKGPKVEAHSSISLSPDQFAKIVSVASSIQIQEFLQNYKME